MDSIMPKVMKKVIYLIAFILLVASSLAAQPGQHFEGEIKAEGIYTFRGDLKAGDFVQYTLEQKGIDLIIAVIGPDGKILIALDNSVGTDGIEVLNWVADSDGQYAVQVEAKKQDIPSGKYVLTMLKRPAAAADRRSAAALLTFWKGLNVVDSNGKFDHKTGISMVEKAVAEWRALKDEYFIGVGERTLAYLKYQMAEGLFFEGKDLIEKGDSAESYRTALQKFEAAKTIYAALGKQEDVAYCIKWSGEAYFALDEKQKAIKAYQDAYALFVKLGHESGQADCLQSIGVTYTTLFDKNKAITYLEKAQEIYQKLQSKDELTICQFNIGQSYLLDDPRKAITFFEQALAHFRETKKRDLEAGTLLGIGVANDYLNNNEIAISKFKEAAAIYTEVNMTLSAATSKVLLGNVYAEVGQVENARREAEAALVILNKGGDKPALAKALNVLGMVHMNKSEYSQALDRFQMANRLAIESGNRVDEALMKNNLGWVYQTLGDYEKAVDYYSQSIDIYTKFFLNKTGLATTLNNLGTAALAMGDLETAFSGISSAAKIMEELNDKRLSTEILNLGNVYEKKGDRVKALEHYERALLMFRNQGDKAAQAKAVGLIANIDRLQGKLNQAADGYSMALLLAREAGDKLNEGIMLNCLMITFYDLGKPEAAAVFGKEAVNKVQGIRQNIKSIDQDTQKLFLGNVERVYRDLADILIEIGRFPEAQAVLDLLKEEEFGKLARRSGEPLYALPYSTAEEGVIGVVEKLAAVGRELGELKASQKARTLTEAELKRLNELEFTEIPAANRALRQAFESLATTAPDVGKLLQTRMKDNVQNILSELGPGTVSLYTVIGKTEAGKGNSVGWILLVTPEFRKAYPIDTTDLEKTVFEFRESLRTPVYDPRPLGQKLYKKLFLQTSEKQKTTLAADLETYLANQKDKTLMWSLDGVLRYVPMAAIHDGKGYLAEKYRNVVFNTASLGSLKDAANPKWEILGYGVSEAKTVKTATGDVLNFSALTGAETELNAVIKESTPMDKDGIFPGSVTLNKNFSKQSFFEGLRGNAPVVHIASHFSYNTVKEDMSFLLMGDGGRLELAEFQDFPNLFNNVDLLSLSACDTATGSAAKKAGGNADPNGREVEGFAYVAQTLGAKSVIASLWQVSDIGTKELMLKFYQIHKSQPSIAKGEALRQAQIALLTGTYAQDAGADKRRSELIALSGQKSLQPLFKVDPKAPLAHPHYWAPFILIGNWK